MASKFKSSKFNRWKCDVIESNSSVMSTILSVMRGASTLGRWVDVGLILVETVVRRDEAGSRSRESTGRRAVVRRAFGRRAIVEFLLEFALLVR